jgi:hypothetical protein
LARHQELGAEALHLLLHGRPHVERRDHGTEPARRGDGLQPGHTRAEHEQLGGRDGPGRRDEHRHQLPVLGGGHQDRLVPGDRAHGREHVHHLGTGDPGKLVEAEAGQLGPCELLDHIGVGEGEQHPDQDGSILGRRDLTLGTPHHQHDVGLAPQRTCVGHDGRPGLGEGFVGVRGRRAGIVFDAHVVPLFDQALHDIGGQRHPRLDRATLFWYGDDHELGS